MPSRRQCVLVRTGLTMVLAGVGCLAHVATLCAQDYGWTKRNQSQSQSQSPSGGAVAGWRSPATSPPQPLLEMDLQAAADGLERIEAGVEIVQEARIATEPVTDVLVRLRHAVRQYRRAPAEDRADDEHSYIEAQLLVVTRGRINPAGIAQCDTFDGDVLVCTIECEGGRFGLRRGQQPGEHYLLVGGGATGGTTPGAGGAGRPGFRLGSCASRAGPALLLLPRHGRLATEVRLTERR